MARGRLFSRKYEPAKPLRSPEELAKSPNPLVQLALAFKKVHNLAPEARPTPASDNVTPRRPLVDINDVRKYVREKLGITKEISTIPLPSPPPSHHAETNPSETNPSETTHTSSRHSYSSDASSLPAHDAAPRARPFDIGTVGHPILEVNEPRRTVSSSSAGSDQPPSATSEPPRRRRSTTTVEVSDMEEGATTHFEVTESGVEQPSTIILESRRHDQASSTYSWIVEPPGSDATRLPQLDMRDVQEFVRGVVEVYRRFENWGLPETSWENKMPWHSPPPKILARGLQRPPHRFASEEERLEFNRAARKRKKFLTGCPPTWSFMVANLALIAFLVYNPLG